ncbi:MAG TPA: hypothetical protein VHK69_05095 [Chitinophagaceae bacterium]|jgi:hypothetical protein|nr:hypothetical protein [Chitinophagaceae bacterium]
MAHVNSSIITGKLRGSLGKELVFREWAGKTVVAKSPKKRKGRPSGTQTALQEKFLLASRYAKSVTKSTDPALAQAYATALKPRQNVYSRAMEDFLTPPSVRSVDARAYTGAPGDTIIVRALDDFRVTGVRVEIHTADGTLLEAGPAVQGLNGIDWSYTATQANRQPATSRIRALASDIPGNEGILEVTL